MKTLYCVGIGPGKWEGLTIEAAEILKKCDVIVGYTTYVELVREHLDGKIFLSTPMTKEVDRCRMAYDEALKGHVTAVICSGDAGIYGMAGLLYEMNAEYPDVEVIVIPGVTSASSGAAILGAPLIHDFAVISLSDRLTPIEKIEKRLAAAAGADFCICLYNPSSHKRHDYLQKACDIILRYQSPETVCGIALRIGREGQSFRVMKLQELRDTEVDMFTTVFIGNSETKNLNGRMVTPRGYIDV